MTREEVYKSLEHLFGRALEVNRRKGADYAVDADAFKNFRQYENLGLCSVEVGMLTRISEKLMRICNLLHKPADVVDESVDDTILDMIVYLGLLKAYREEQCLITK